MKEKILEINEKLKNNEITSDKAQHLLLCLFSVKQRYFKVRFYDNFYGQFDKIIKGNDFKSALYEWQIENGICDNYVLLEEILP